MVEVLIKNDVRINDALLYSIRKQMVSAVKMLLYQMKKHKKFCMVRNMKNDSFQEKIRLMLEYESFKSTIISTLRRLTKMKIKILPQT